MKRTFNYPMTKKRILLYCFLMAAIILISDSASFASRPFISTDASVADPGRLQLELGFFNFIHDRKNIFNIPSLKFNYGLIRDWEIVAESDIQVYNGESNRDFEIISPAIFSKNILWEGILQGKQGPSFAVESGILLPSSVKGERNIGLSSVGIMSYKFSDFLFHINAGAELDRVNFKSNAVWGIIGEYPFEGRFRLVGEIAGTAQHDGPPENSALIGFVWNSGKVDYDFGFRKGLSDDAPDWELTSGVTFYF